MLSSSIVPEEGNQILLLFWGRFRGVSVCVCARDTVLFSLSYAFFFSQI